MVNINDTELTQHVTLPLVVLCLHNPGTILSGLRLFCLTRDSNSVSTILAENGHLIEPMVHFLRPWMTEAPQKIILVIILNHFVV